MRPCQIIEGHTSAIFGHGPPEADGYQTKNELCLDHQAFTNHRIRNS